MDSHKLAVKFFAADPSAISAEAVVPIFHRWIQEKAVPDHLLIDVADYAHVVNGPGMLLVSHEANFHIDFEDGKPGLLYFRKQPFDQAEAFEDRLRATLHAALAACVRLEDDPRLDGLRFATDRFLFRINDRLLAPNTAETLAHVRPGIERVVRALYPDASPDLARREGADRPFEVMVKLSQSPPARDLIERLQPRS